MGIKEKKVLGVLGGMGPLATQLFYKMIIEKTDAHCDQEHLDMLILSHATMPDRTKAILEGRTEELFQMLRKDAMSLEANGAGVIAIPCNTSHVLADRLQEEISVPIIHMIRETAAYLARQFPQQEGKVGILATDGTINTGLYQQELQKVGLVPVVPDEMSQRLVMKLIYDGIKNGGEIDFADFLMIQEDLKNKGCDAAILACTELSCFKEQYKLPPYYIDAMDILTEQSILSCGGNIKEG
ncbi:aspartate/glutamate racemase family protein [Anoxybacterium hadale]|uniref:Aspartate/glutamate racemase family protein n=2 Tax=Anoxybacterium hadale TaxID=3408580 RepID=A0ACD1AIF1_9FIRM|nr:aspartate/glutamate racemase family protein [Clostridiales bacterium]